LEACVEAGISAGETERGGGRRWGVQPYSWETPPVNRRCDHKRQDKSDMCCLVFDVVPHAAACP